MVGDEAHQDDDITEQMITAERTYPEKVHVATDYLVESTYDYTWDKIWYVSKEYKFHMCPKRIMFNDVHYKFKMIGKEEKEKKFIFSYGIGNATVKTKHGDMVINHVKYTPEVSLNVLSLELLANQGY